MGATPDSPPPSSLLIDPDACYLPAQLAAYLQVSEATLKDWRYRGGGPKHLKLKNGRIRYEGREILAWKDTIRRRTTSDAPALRVVREERRRD
jgi:predicted site-specific integrase-resolvase